MLNSFVDGDLWTLKWNLKMYRHKDIKREYWQLLIDTLIFVELV